MCYFLMGVNHNSLFPKQRQNSLGKCRWRPQSLAGAMTTCFSSVESPESSLKLRVLAGLSRLAVSSASKSSVAALLQLCCSCCVSVSSSRVLARCAFSCSLELDILVPHVRYFSTYLTSDILVPHVRYFSTKLYKESSLRELSGLAPNSLD
jgi:hypothetical protein